MKSDAGIRFEAIFANHLSTCKQAQYQEDKRNLTSEPNSILATKKYTSPCFCQSYQGNIQPEKLKQTKNTYETKDLEQMIQDTFLKKSTFMNNSNADPKLFTLHEDPHTKHETLDSSIKLLTPQEVQKFMGDILGADYRRLFYVQYINKIFQEYFTASNKHYKDSQLRIKPTYIYFLL